MPTILPLGDSLTAGSDQTPGGYRTYRGTLQTLLATAGIASLDFIGPNQSTPASGGSDPDHAGWGGAVIDNDSGSFAANNLTARLATLKTSFPAPDLIIVWAGWNDVYSQPTNLANRFETFLNAVQSGAWAGRKCLVCTLHPEPGKTEAQTGATYSAYAALNARIRTLCAAAPSTRILADLAALSGANQTSFAEDLISDVVLAPDGMTVLGGGEIQSAGGGCLITSFRSIVDFNANWSRTPPNPVPLNGNTGEMDSAEAVVNGVNRFVTSCSAVVPWAWMYCAPGHASSNTCIEVRNGFAQAKRIGGGWQFFFQGSRFGDRLDFSLSLPKRTTVGFGNYDLGYRPDGITSWYKPDGNYGIEVWPRDTVPSRGVETFVGGHNRDLMANAECFAWGCQMRLALINPSGVDDRAQARLLVKAGMDVFSPLGGRRYDRYGWPYNAMDGSAGRWKLLRSNDWTTVGAVSIGRNSPTSGPQGADEAWEDPGLQPPMADWSPATTYNNIPTYSLGVSAVRAAPPVVPTYWETTGGGTGSGYPEADYWFNPSSGFRDIHLLQANADRVAGVMSRAIVLNNVFGGGGSSGIIFAPLPGLPTRPNVFLTLASGLINVEPKAWDTSSAPVWGPATSLPAATVGAAYSGQLLATGTPAPTFTIVSGAPAWLSCSSAGALTGTPTGTATTHTITFRATNTVAGVTTTVDQVLTLSVVDGASIVTTSLPNAVQGQAYSQTLAATGAAPFTWTITAGALPAGLALLADTIIGTPTTLGTPSFTVQVTDALGRTATRSLSILVGAASNLPVITTATLPAGTVGVSYSQTIAATGAGTITRAVVSGSLPPGLALNPTTGVLSGTPTAAGGYGFTVRATNAFGFVEATYYLTIAATAVAPVASPWGQFIRQ